MRRPRRLVGAALGPPVLLFDRLDLLFGHPEVVADLVDQRLADGHHDVVVVVAGVLDGPLVEHDAIGQRVAVVPAPLGQRRALVEAEQRVRRLDLHLGQQLVARLVLDDDGEVLDLAAEPSRDRADRFGDEALEPSAGHRRFLARRRRRARGGGAATPPGRCRACATAGRLDARRKSQSALAAHRSQIGRGLADAAAVQDQRVGGARPQRRRKRAGQLLLDALGIVG